MSAAQKASTVVHRLTVSPQEAAEMLSVDRVTIFRWIKQGKLSAFKLSPRIVRIRVSDIEALLIAGRL